MQVEWKDSYLIGESNLDAQHQRLFVLVNQFLQAKDKGERTHCAMQLYTHTREHFAYEERLMRACDFPSLRLHTYAHLQMLSDLNTVSNHIQDGTLEPEELVKLLGNWALVHIPVHDAQLAAYLRAKKEPPAEQGGA